MYAKRPNDRIDRDPDSLVLHLAWHNLFRKYGEHILRHRPLRQLSELRRLEA